MRYELRAYKLPPGDPTSSDLDTAMESPPFDTYARESLGELGRGGGMNAWVASLPPGSAPVLMVVEDDGTDREPSEDETAQLMEWTSVPLDSVD